jgi:DNA-directed RNA polymerase specialized sigma24 family protein
VRIVRFKKSALWRKAKRRREAGDVPAPAPAEDGSDPLDNVASRGDPDPEEIAQGRQRVRVLANAVAQLSGRCRELLRRKIEGQSFVEMAADLGRPVNTVYSWDRRCHQRLRRILGARWGFVSGKEGA